MSGSAQRARRLVTGGWVLLATPVVWLAAASLLLVVRPVPVLSILVWLLTALWVGNLLLGIVDANRRRPPEPGSPEEDEAGVLVSAVEQPELWALVAEVAAAAGLSPPAELRLTAVGHVAAWSPPPTRLDVGVPLLFVLDRRGLTALIARALAVADSGWGAAAPSVHRLRTVVRGMSGRQLPGGVATSLLRSLDRQWAEGELEADAVAVAVTDRGTAGRALGWAHAVHTATLWWFDEYVLPELLQDRQPRPLLPGLEALLGDPARRADLARAAVEALPPGDGSSPGLADRVNGLLVGVDGDHAWGEPVAGLLRAPSTVLDQLADAVLATPRGSSSHEPRTWSQSLESWAERTSHATAALLTAAAGPETTLAEILDGVALGRLPEWAARVADGTGSDADDLPCFLLTGTLASALHVADAGRLTAEWSGTIDVVDTGGVRLELPRAVEMVVADPALVPDLRALLVELGVPLDRPHPAAEARGGRTVLPFGRSAGHRRPPGTGFPAAVAPF